MNHVRIHPEDLAALLSGHQQHLDDGGGVVPGDVGPLGQNVPGFGGGINFGGVARGGGAATDGANIGSQAASGAADDQITHQNTFLPQSYFTAHPLLNNMNFTGANLQNSNYQGAVKAGQSNYNAAAGGQGRLAQMLEQQAQGLGPNPAQEQLKQATDRNLSQAYAMAQSTGGNDAGAARNLANQRGNISQQAASDSSVLRQQQMLQAQQELQGVYGQEGAQGIGEMGAAGQLQNVQNSNLMTNTFTPEQYALSQAQGNQQAIGQANSTNAGTSIANSSGANLAPQIIGAVGGAAQGAAAAGAKAAGAAHGGIIPGYSDGGQIPGYGYGAGATAPPQAGIFSDFPVREAMGGRIPMLSGGQVPGHASIAGDSAKNDTVPAMLSPGEEVIPRSVVGDRGKEIAFLDAVRKGKGPKPTFRDVLESGRRAGIR